MATTRHLRTWLLALAVLLFAGLALAQADPTIQEIYATAKSGQVDKAREMTQQVLRDHPKSAKAHFVLAELDASQGRTAQAREDLAAAESLAPGLPFAKPEAVQALRERLNANATLPAQRDVGATAARAVREPAPASSFPWGMVLVAGAVVAFLAWRFRPRPLAPSASAPEVAPAGYGPVPGTAWGTQPQPGGYGQQPGYGPQQGYGTQPAQSGMGGRIMGGLATGLAVGAGAVAAQEIGRRMLGEHDQGQRGLGSVPDSHGGASDSQLARDAGLGGIGAGGAGGGFDLPQDFGVADGGSWDDGGGSMDLGGGDDGGSWDS
jgi:hypothetical protein